MRNKIIYIIFTVLITSVLIFYIGTLASSFIAISKAIKNNSVVELDYYIDNELLENNFEILFYDFLKSNFDKKELNLSFLNTDFSGELNENSRERLIYFISRKLSKDFSQTDILLFFYFNSNKIDSYLEKNILYNANYSFQEFLLSNNAEIEKDYARDDINEVNKKDIKNELNLFEKLTIYYDNFIKFTKKIDRSEYIFFINPHTFKLNVQHKSENYIVLLKLKGMKWSIVSIDFKLNNHLFD